MITTKDIADMAEKVRENINCTIIDSVKIACEILEVKDLKKIIIN